MLTSAWHAAPQGEWATLPIPTRGARPSGHEPGEPLVTRSGRRMVGRAAARSPVAHVPVPGHRERRRPGHRRARGRARRTGRRARARRPRLDRRVRERHGERELRALARRRREHDRAVRGRRRPGTPRGRGHVRARALGPAAAGRPRRRARQHRRRRLDRGRAVERDPRRPRGYRAADGRPGDQRPPRARQALQQGMDDEVRRGLAADALAPDPPVPGRLRPLQRGRERRGGRTGERQPRAQRARRTRARRTWTP